MSGEGKGRDWRERDRTEGEGKGWDGTGGKVRKGRERMVSKVTPSKQEAQLLLGDRATRKHAKDS